MAGIYCLALIGDKGFDARWLRKSLSTHCHALREDRQMLAAIINLVATVLRTR
jgi:hypothetical protein